MLHVVVSPSQGVRGVASFWVVVTHLCRAWDYSLWSPRDNENATPQLLQLPFLRLPWQGRIGVTMFAFLTGYVCAIKPLRQAKSGNIPAALETLGKSAVRRPPRLIMPATIALVLAWFFAQIGAFEVAHRSDSHWLRRSVPTNIGGLDAEIPRLIRNFQRSWSGANNEYDDHQWALLPLLQGAFLIYVLLFATVFMKFRMRLFTCVTLFFWYWMRTSPEKGMSWISLFETALANCYRNVRMPIPLRCHPLRCRVGEVVPGFCQQSTKSSACSHGAPHHHRMVRCVLPRRELGVGNLVCPAQVHWRLVYSGRRGQHPQAVHGYRMGSDGHWYLVVAYFAKRLLQQAIHVGWPQQLRRVPYPRYCSQSWPSTVDLRVEHQALLY